MWRRLVIALLCAAVSFGFNSNMPGGSISGGNCTGGQFMTGITAGGAPVCSTPSGGAPYPPGSPPQIGGFSALNTSEAQTVVGDFTFARTGTAQLTATVTKLNGITPGGTCTGSQFVNVISASGVPTCAALPAPAAGSITDTMLANAYSGVGTCTGGQFVSTLNRNAAPTCTAPPVGFTAGNDLSGTATSQTVIGIRSTSVPALAPGYLHYNGTVFVWDTPGGGFAAGGDLSGSATTQTVIGIRSTSVPALATGYLQYTGSAFVWSTPAVGAPATNPVGGANNYAPIASPTFTGAVAAPTLNLTGTAPALTFAGVAIGGTCGGGQFVNVISNTGVPTCTTPSGLATPVSIANGGTGTATAPTTGMILVAQSTSAYGPVVMSGDASISTLGGVTVTKLNGTTPGGTCTGGQFVSAINASGVPTCTTPSAAGGYPPGAPAQIAGFSAVNTAEAETLTGDAVVSRTAANTYSMTVSKLNGVTVGALATLGVGTGLTSSGGNLNLTAPVSIANGGRGSTTAPAIGQLDIASSTTAFTPVTMSGDCTIASTGAITCTKINGVSGPFLTGAAASITDAMLANSYSGVGACTAGSVATTLNRNAAPTCTTMSSLGSGLFAPLTNPTGGQNNYAPLASPTFTGTVTMPDASTLTSAGINNLTHLGVGVAAPTGVTEAVFQNNANNNTNIQVVNNNTGANAASILYMSNGTHYGALQMNGTAGTSNGFAADTLALQSNGTGINISVSGGYPIMFYMNATTDEGYYGTNGLNITHIANDSNMAVPTVSGTATLATGSRDTFGEISVPPAMNGAVTLTFARAFGSSAYCMANTGGGAFWWYQTARSTTSISFQCVTPAGANCTGGVALDYFCFGFQ